jgi:hypothetical protein
MTLPHPRGVVEDYADESLTTAASFTSEGARIVCHHRVVQVGTMYAIVAEFYTAAFAIETAVDNMSGELGRMDPAALYDHGKHADVPTAIEEARQALAIARRHANQLGAALQAAQNAIAGVGHRTTD